MYKLVNTHHPTHNTLTGTLSQATHLPHSIIHYKLLQIRIAKIAKPTNDIECNTNNMLKYVLNYANREIQQIKNLVLLQKTHK